MPGPDGPLVKLLDFGIASARGSAVELSGTLTYMAPEVLTGQPPSPTSDLYAVGILLYQMLYGRMPSFSLEPDKAAASPEQISETGSWEEEGDETVAAPEWTLASQEHTVIVDSGPRASGLAELTRSPLYPLSERLAALLQSLLAPDPALRIQQAEQALRELSEVVLELTGTALPANTAETRESFLQAAVLVGRQQELSQLESALVGLLSGRGGLVLLGGESGVGKSRLLEELRTLALVRGVRTLRGQAISNGGTAYQVFHEALRALALSVEFSDEDAAVLKEVVADLPAVLGRVLPDAPALVAKDSQERVRRVLLSALTPGEEPLLLLLEDLHWVQKESRELLNALAAAAGAAPLLLVASFRDDEFPELPKQFPMAQSLTLRRLAAPAISHLSQSMLGEAGGQPALLAFLERETEGNALFIVEVLRALAEEAGGLDAIGSQSLPRHISSGGIEAVVQRRLGRAPPWTRPWLKLAAVSGRQIDRRLLASLQGDPEAWLQACLDAALLEVRESEWRFAHDKLREALLSSLPATELKSLHAQLAAAIERAYPENERPLAALADHFERGGDAVKAARYASLAGSKALRSGALHEALALLERARSLQEQTRAPGIDRAATLRRLSRTLLAMGRTPESIACVQQALLALDQPIPEKRLARWLALAREAGVELRHRFLGVRREEAPHRQAELRELLALIRGTNESLFITNGHHDELLLVMLRALHAAERVDDRRQQVNFLSRLAYTSYLAPLHELGRFYLRRARQLSQRWPESGDGSGFYAMSAYFGAAEGDWEASVDGFDRWLASATRNGFGEQVGICHTSRAATCMLMGDLAGTLADAEACLRIGQRMQNPIFVGSYFGWRALVQLHRGELAAALASAREALGHVRDIRDNPSRMSAYNVLAYVAVVSGHLDEAAAHLDSGLACLQRFLPAAPSYQLIYHCALLTGLELAAQARSDAERAAAERRVRQAMLRLLHFALRFPIGRSLVYLGVGRYLALHGQHRAAVAVLAAGLPSARRYRMRHDEGLLHWSIATVGTAGGEAVLPRAEQRRHLERCCQLFQALGAERERAAAQALLSVSQTQTPRPAG